MGVTELLYTHTFYESSRVALTYDLSDSDLMWEFTSRNVHDWIAVHFPRELYTDKSPQRLVLSMRDTLKEVGDKTGVGPGIDIVENFVHVFYKDVRVKSFNTVEILLRGDTGRPIPFSGGVVEVTLHFRKK